VWGLENINFTDLRIGAPIQTYNYINNNLVPSGELFPISANGELVLWASPQGDQYQISNALVSEINSVITNGTSFSLVYDATSAYIYTNGDATLIKEFTYTVPSRSNLTTSTDLSTFDIETTSLSNSVSIGYGVASRNAPQNVWCSVTNVPQNYSYTCWAATIACIYNYVNDLTGSAMLDDRTVAREVFGLNFDQMLEWEDVAWALGIFDLDYIGTNINNLGGLQENIIFNSIYNGFPVFGCFDVLDGDGHAATIYGCNIIAGRLVVMDPLGGSFTAYMDDDGNYRYSNIYTNDTLVLYSAFGYRE
jgi:hypothetical protein